MIDADDLYGNDIDEEGDEIIQIIDEEEKLEYDDEDDGPPIDIEKDL